MGSSALDESCEELTELTRVRDIVEGLGKQVLSPVSHVYSRKKVLGGFELGRVVLGDHVDSRLNPGDGFLDINGLELSGGTLQGFFGAIMRVDDHLVSELVCRESADFEMEVEPLAMCFPVGDQGEDLCSFGVSIGFRRWCLHFDTWWGCLVRVMRLSL